MLIAVRSHTGHLRHLETPQTLLKLAWKEETRTGTLCIEIIEIGGQRYVHHKHETCSRVWDCQLLRVAREEVLAGARAASVRPNVSRKVYPRVGRYEYIGSRGPSVVAGRVAGRD